MKRIVRNTSAAAVVILLYGSVTRTLSDLALARSEPGHAAANAFDEYGAVTGVFLATVMVAAWPGSHKAALLRAAALVLAILAAGAGLFGGIPWAPDAAGAVWLCKITLLPAGLAAALVAGFRIFAPPAVPEQAQHRR